jgi:Zn-dependent protease with chaperone function
LSISGIFINGRTGAKTEVDLRIIKTSLEIRDPRDNLMLALWALGDIEPVRPLKAGRRVKRLRMLCRNDPESRLDVENPETIALLQKANRTLRPPRRPLPRWARWVAVAAAALFAFWLLLELMTAAAGPLTRGLPSSWETGVGQRLAVHLIRRLGGVCGASGGQAALDSLGQRFDRDASQNPPVQLFAVKATEINSFALPGRIVIVTAGMIRDIETPEQFAGMVAHQLAHIDLGHTARHIVKQTGFGMAVLATIGPPLPFANAALSDVLVLSYNRQEEAEANVFGQALLKKADISAQSIGSYFRLLDLREKSQGFPTGFQEAHPSPGKRQETQAVQPFSRPPLSDREWQSLRGICN